LAARPCYEHALALADGAGAARTAAMLRLELGIALQEIGRLDEAESTLERAVSGFLQVGDHLNHVAALYGLGNVLQERGSRETAEQAYREVVAAMARAGVSTLRGIALAALGVLLASRDDLDGAARAFAEADAALGSGAGTHWGAALSIHRGHLDLARARKKEADGRCRAEAERRLRTGAGLAGTSDDVRLLVALTTARRATPGKPLTREALLQRAWPGERILPRAGASRIYVSILELRDLGLRDLLQSESGGYLLDPDVSVVTVGAEAGERS
jgi:tetratricopeptide (TPR) repeat protein